ncbi:MAG: protein kinase [Kofleriaceae bacterium]
MTACLDDNQLARLIDGKLDADERRVIEGHLDDCASCGALVGELGTQRELPTRRELPAGLSSRTALAPRYQPVREIARGGMGRVVEAFDVQLGRTVAIKHALDDDPAARLRFEREVAITARLEHPSIVPLYDAGELDGEPFYVMRKVTGAPLDQIVRDAVTLDQRLQLIPHVLAAADAVAHAHARGVIHRDLKPSNVLVGEFGETVVIDWGLAKLVGTADLPAGTTPISGLLETAAGTVAGTPGFMAPEQVTSGLTDTRADVFALGACLYYTLTGRLPVRGTTEAELLARTREGRIETLDVAGIPTDLAAIVATALQRDPADRYRDAAGFSDDLRRFLGGQLVAAHRYGRGERAARWIRRHRALVVAIVAGLAVAVAITVIAFVRVLAEQDRTQVALDRERDRADELVIARATLESDPTRAAAVLAELRPESPRWATLGPLFAELRARGIVNGYPGHTMITIAKFAPRGPRLLSMGGGIVRLLDLEARTSRLIATGSPMMRAMWWGDAIVIVRRDRGVGPELFDPATGTRTPLAWAAATDVLAAEGSMLAQMTEAGDVVTREVGGVAITAPCPRARWAQPIANGRWIVCSSGDATQVLVRAGATWKVVGELAFTYATLAVAPSEARIAFTTASSREIVELATTTWTETRRWRIPDVLSIGYVGDTLYTSSPEAVMRLEADGSTSRIAKSSSLSPPQDVAGASAILTTGHDVAIAHASYRHTLRSPIELSGLVADRSGHYLVGFGAGRLVVWDLAAALPLRATVPGGDAVIYGEAAVLVSAMPAAEPPRRVFRLAITREPAVAIDAPVVLGPIGAMAEPVALAHGVVAVVDRSLATIEVPLWKLRRREATAVAGISTDAVVIGTRAGALEQVTSDTTATPLTTLAGPITSIATGAGWIAACDGAGASWRRDPSGRETRAQIGGITSNLAIAAGVLYAGRGASLLAWADSPVVIATASEPIELVRALPDDRVIVVGSRTIARFDPSTTTLRAIRQTGSAIVAFATADNGSFAATSTTAGVELIDLRTPAHWPVLDTPDIHALALSPDGRYLVAVAGTTLLHVSVGSPLPSPAAIGAATNAIAPRGPRDELVFRDLQ